MTKDSMAKDNAKSSPDSSTLRVEWPTVEVKLPDVQEKRKPESPVAKMFIGGAASLAFEFGGGHAIQFLKIQKQTTGLPYSTIIKQITQKKGFSGLLDGFFPWGAIIAVGKGAVFAFGHAGAKRALDGLMPGQMAEIVAGGCGGFVQGIVANPLLLFTTRVMTNPAFREKQGFFQFLSLEARPRTRQMTAFLWSYESARALVGRNQFGYICDIDIPTTVIASILTRLHRHHQARGPHDFDERSTRFFFVVIIEELIRRGEARQLSFKEKCGASLAGGVLSCAVTIPLDVMVATVQQNAKAGQKVPLLKTAVGILRGKGMAGLFAFSTRGLVARATHVALATLLMKTLTSSIYDIVYPEVVVDRTDRFPAPMADQQHRHASATIANAVLSSTAPSQEAQLWPGLK